jgi:CubicO group peptidase (beta-lactamase class C family)
VLDEAFSEPDAAHPRRTRAVVVVQNGRLVAERYADGIGPGTRLLGWSMTKSIMNALVGILVGDGRLSVHAPAPVEAWRNPGDPRQQITLDHLMRMSSGLQSSDDGMVPFNDVTQMLFQTPDMAAFASAKDLDAAPGVEWRYSSGSSLIVSSILRRVLGDEAYHRFPYSALFGPLGMTSAVLETDASGTFVGSSLMYASARDWARFGLLYAQDGIWNGHRILPTGWVDYTRTPSPADPRHIYGAHFWLRVPPDYTRRHALVPDDAFHAVGHEAQFVSVVPSRNAVIVRLGKTRYPDAWDHSVFLSAVLAALDE